MSIAIAETRWWSLGVGGPRLHCSVRITGLDVTLWPSVAVRLDREHHETTAARTVPQKNTAISRTRLVMIHQQSRRLSRSSS